MYNGCCKDINIYRAVPVLLRQSTHECPPVVGENNSILQLLCILHRQPELHASFLRNTLIRPRLSLWLLFFFVRSLDEGTVYWDHAEEPDLVLRPVLFTALLHAFVTYSPFSPGCCRERRVLSLIPCDTYFHHINIIVIFTLNVWGLGYSGNTVCASFCALQGSTLKSNWTNTKARKPMQ